MAQRPLLIETLRVPPRQEAEFTEFYHHRFLPRLLTLVPEVLSVRRYEEYGTSGSLRWFTKRFVTIYELTGSATVRQLDTLMTRADFETEREDWRFWQSVHLREISQISYEEIYRHERQPADGRFGNRPFFQVSVQLRPEQTTAFRAWYHEEYLPKIMADVPTWVACRRYASTEPAPLRELTIYEVNSLAELDEAFALMRAPYRYGSNADWDRWVGTAILEQDATSYRPIYRRPG